MTLHLAESITIRLPSACAVALLSGLLSVPAVAAAQSAPAETATGDVQAQAAEAFELASRLFQEQNWAGALAAFQRAYDLQPHYSVLFNIGFCLKSLQRYPEALEALERYLAEGGDQVRPEKRAQAEQAIADLRTFISRVTVTADVDGAQILVNGQARGTAPLPAPLVLGAGHYVIEARAPDHRDARSEFDLGPAEERTVALTLEPFEAVAPPPPDNPPPPPPDNPPPPVEEPSAGPAWYDDWLGWTLAGGGLAVGLGGGLCLLAAFGNQNDFDNATDMSVAYEAGNKATTFRITGGVLAGAGIAALVTGIVLLAIPEDSETPEEGEEPAVALTPLVGPLGLGLAGTF